MEISPGKTNQHSQFNSQEKHSASFELVRVERDQFRDNSEKLLTFLPGGLSCGGCSRIPGSSMSSFPLLDGSGYNQGNLEDFKSSP